MSEQQKQKKVPFYSAAVRWLYRRFVSLLSPRAGRRSAEKQRAQFTAQDVRGRYIFSQHRDAAAEMAFGHSTFSHAGCGTIAVYNLLFDMGQDVALSDVLYAAQRQGTVVAGGRLGSNPRRMGRLLQQFGQRAQLCITEQEFFDTFSQGDRAIVCFWHSDDIRDGAHFVFAAARSNPTRYAVYNSLRRGFADRPLMLREKAEIWGSGRYITAWVVKAKQ
ncbi:MAG: hypothetical protein IJP01_01970 [Oscillospiraceae bacterium]|nr:hypothetical protein [Oscillospiraceae bacterium]